MSVARLAPLFLAVLATYQSTCRGSAGAGQSPGSQRRSRRHLARRRYRLAHRPRKEGMVEVGFGASGPLPERAGERRAVRDRIAQMRQVSPGRAALAQAGESRSFAQPGRRCVLRPLRLRPHQAHRRLGFPFTRPLVGAGHHRGMGRLRVPTLPARRAALRKGGRIASRQGAAGVQILPSASARSRRIRGARRRRGDEAGQILGDAPHPCSSTKRRSSRATSRSTPRRSASTSPSGRPTGSPRPPPTG